MPAASLPETRLLDQAHGLLQRRHVRIDSINAIGKESNSLEEVEAGLVHDEQNVYTEYSDRRRDYWSREVVPALGNLPLNVWERESGGRETGRVPLCLNVEPF